MEKALSNWFENNPVRSIITHTIVVAAAVWAFSFFVLEDNKIKFYEAMIKKSEAEAKETEARNAVLVTRVEYLSEENKKLNDWLIQTPQTIPYYENQLQTLKAKLKVAEDKLLTSPEKTPSKDLESLYKNFQKGEASTTFLDLKTNLVLGVPKINYGDTADINLTLPNGEKIDAKNIKAGETWQFSKGGKDYLLIMDSIDWAAQSYKSSVIELGLEKDDSTKH
nr:hypothetical protein [Pseudomonas toyotomiensis]